MKKIDKVWLLPTIVFVLMSVQLLLVFLSTMYFKEHQTTILVCGFGLIDLCVYAVYNIQFEDY